MKTKLLPLVAACLAAASAPTLADTTIDNMFSEGSMRAQLRLFDFTRDFDGATNTNHDTSIGGLFYYKTATVNGISFGASFASANHLWVDDSEGVYGILARPDHGNVNRMQEYYVQAERWDTNFKLGAQELRTPMMNPHDIRGIPRTFRGFSAVNNSVDNLTLSALYITDSMGWADQNFVTVSDAVQSELARAGLVTEIADNPVYAAGATYNIPYDSVKVKVDLWHYRMDDVFNQTFFKVNMSTDVGATNLYFAPTYWSQESAGDETGGERDTEQYGATAGAKLAGANLSFTYAKTGDDGMLTPWGDDKIVIMQVNQSARADETVKAFKLDYDFGNAGVKGLSAYVFHGQFDAPTTSGGDFTETDFSVNYQLDNVLKGLSVRARHAIVDYDNGEDLNDTRFYVKYDFSI
ncbi:OprD family outer membrane porin [Shewanella sp. A14]